MIWTEHLRHKGVLVELAGFQGQVESGQGVGESVGGGKRVWMVGAECPAAAVEGFLEQGTGRPVFAERGRR